MERQAWNNLVRQYAPRFGAFLQSWEWGAFQESLGRRVERVHINNTHGVLVAQGVQLDLPFGGKYWTVPKGPLGTMPLARREKELKRILCDGAFVRVEPSNEPSGWKVKDVQPSTTSILDLTQGREVMLATMKAKTRYNMRLAEKKGVTTRVTGVETFADFQRLLEQTAVRDNFSLHPASYYAAMLEQVRGEARAFLAFADYEGRPIAANLMVDFNGQRTYLHGASSNLHRNVMAPYVLHMRLIDDALARGMTSYDFWGVAPIGSGESHPWAGISRFKLGFGGEVVAMPGTFDLPTTLPVYAMYRAAKLFQTFRRRHA